MMEWAGRGPLPALKITAGQGETDGRVLAQTSPFWFVEWFRLVMNLHPHTVQRPSLYC